MLSSDNTFICPDSCYNENNIISNLTNNEYSGEINSDQIYNNNSELTYYDINQTSYINNYSSEKTVSTYLTEKEEQNIIYTTSYTESSSPQTTTP